MSESEPAPQAEHLRRLLTEADGVIFDFDGPMCDLFPGGTAGQADQMKRKLRGLWGHVPDAIDKLHDSHDILKELRDRPADDVVEVADLVTAQELEAVHNAPPARHLLELLDELARLAKPLAIASNNAEEPILEFLQIHGLDVLFASRVHGRGSRALRRMKPDPQTVARAVEDLEVPPGSCLMLGDKASDLEAAREVGIRFVGCTSDSEERARMEMLGADAVVESLAPLHKVATRMTG